MTMDLLDGDTLAVKIAADGRLSSADAAHYLEQILAGVGAVHAAGIVHRDIKPQNVFILPGPPERALVMDFGLARRLSPTQSAITGQRIVGTADYMAPEQVQGCPPHRSFDIYALGVVTLRDAHRAKALSEPNAGRARERSTAPDAAATVARRAGLDPAWDDVVLGCLAFEPRDRFANVEAIAAKLRSDVLRIPGARTKRSWQRWGTDALAVLALVTAVAVIVHRLSAGHASSSHDAMKAQHLRRSPRLRRALLPSS